MAKTTRRKYWKRRSGKWSSNIQNLNLTGTAQPNTRFGDSFTIAQNPAQANTTVSQQYTVKNVEISGYIESTTYSNLKDLTYYIMYVPEGYAVGLDLPYNHPEWIMAYKYIGVGASSSSGSFDQPPRIKTRLSRRLNTGDSIIFLYIGNNTATSGASLLTFRGLVRWWTKAN